MESKETTPDTPLRVSRLEAVNFKGLREVDIRQTDRTLVLIHGPNRAGKTSCLDALRAALTGKKAEGELPLRDGADTGTIRLTLRDDLADRWRVDAEWHKRKEKAGGGVIRSLALTDLGGERPMRVPKGQTVLDQLVADLSFDPLEFARLDKSKQGEAFLAAAGMEDAYSRKVGEIKAAEAVRRDANADVRAAGQHVAGLSAVPETPLTQRDPAEATTLLDEAQQIDARRTEYTRRVEKVDEDIERYRQVADPDPDQPLDSVDIDALKDAVAEAEMALAAGMKINELAAEQGHYMLAQEQINELRKARKIHVEAADALPSVSVEDAMALQTEIAEHNRQVMAQGAYQDAAERERLAKLGADRASDGVDEARQSLRDLVSGCPLANEIQGLGIDEDGDITINGIPFSSCSGAERRLVAMKIAVMGNAALKIACVDEADSLDDDSLEELAAIAQQHGCTVWMTGTRARDADCVQSVAIEDGTTGKAVALGDAT